jgi:hypothetical protein
MISDFFRNRLVQIIDFYYPLTILTNRIFWFRGYARESVDKLTKKINDAFQLIILKNLIFNIS